MNPTPFCLCQICAISVPKHMVIDRISSNGQNGTKSHIYSRLQVMADIPEVMILA